jgi:hypothetical protein
MAYPTGMFTGADGDLDVYIPEIWGQAINDFAKEDVPATDFFTDRSSELMDGGDTIHTGNLTEMTAYSKSNATAVTLNSPTETDVDLVVDTWYEVSFAVEDGDVAIWKKSLYLQERMARNAGYTAGQTLENSIIALFASFTSTAGASTSEIADSDIRKAIGIVETATKESVENGSIAFFFDRKVWWNQIAGIDTFQLKINATADPVTKQPMKMLYGIPVKTSSNIDYVSGSTGRVNVLAHYDAIHYATAKLPRQTTDKVRVQSQYDQTYLATLTTADIKYGVIMNRATYGCIIYSSAS